jgi:hypothetical protein
LWSACPIIVDEGGLTEGTVADRASEADSGVSRSIVRAAAARVVPRFSTSPSPMALRVGASAQANRTRAILAGQKAVMADVASPLSTGAGGPTFEARVQGAFLASMLTGTPCPCLPLADIRELRFQARQLGYATDDLVAKTSTADGQQHRLLCQIKRTVTPSRFDSEFREFLASAWADFSSTERFDVQRDAIALITGPQSSRVVEHLRPILEWARHSATASEFFSKVRAPRFSSKGKRDFVDTITAILAEVSPHPVDEASLWRFFRVFHLLAYDYDIEYGQDEARLISMLRLAKNPLCVESESSLWAQIIVFGQVLNQNAGTLSWLTMGEDLPPVLRNAFRSDGPVTKAQSLRRLAEHTELTLRGISAEFAPGVTLQRSALVDSALEQIESAQVLLVTGDAGDGKSVVAKQVLDHMARNGVPVFAFRIEEFEAPHIHQALVQMGVQDTLEELSARFALLPRRVLLVDSVERLFELGSRDAFAQLLDSVARDRSWRIILSVRSQSLDLLVSHVLPRSGAPFATLSVDRLTEAELHQVVVRVPRLAAFVNDPRVADILRTPLYLRMACQAREDALDKATAMIGPSGLRRYLWREVVERPAYQRDGLPVRRRITFVALAVRRAKRMEAFVSADGLDLEALQRLASDDLVTTNAQGLYAPAQDLLEDWALYAYIEECFVGASRPWGPFLERVGAEPATRRAFRTWLTNNIPGERAQSLADFVVDVTGDASVKQHWRDEALVAALLSDQADDFLSRIRPALVHDEGALLRRVIHLLRTACKGPNEKLIRRLAANPRSVRLLGLALTRTVGRGWEAVIHLLASCPELSGLRDSPVVIALLDDWTLALDPDGALPAEAEDCARLAIHYFGLLTEPDVYADKLPEKCLDILLRVPHALPAEVRSLFAPTVVEGAFDERHGTRGLRLLAERALAWMACTQLCRHLPDIVIGVLDHYPWRRSLGGRFEPHMGIEPYFGLQDDLYLKHFPASALQGPFGHLLRWHPTDAMACIVRLVDRAAEAYARSGLDGTIPSLRLRLAGERERSVIASPRLWRLYRGTHVAPHIAESALMALEEWLLSQAEAGQGIEAWAQLILESTTSVAPLAVLASVAIAKPSALGKHVLPLLSTLDFYLLDLERVVTDAQPADPRAWLGTPTPVTQDFHYEERKRANERLHRRESLEGVTVRLMGSPLRPELAAAIDRMMGEAGGHTVFGDSVAARMTLKRIDLRGYEVVEQTPKGTLIQPKVNEPDLRSAIEMVQERGKRADRVMRLHNWALATFTGSKQSGVPFASWRDALEDAYGVEGLLRDAAEGELGMADHRRLRVLGSVAACLIRDHRSELAVEEVRWCIVQIRDAVEENCDAWDEPYGRLTVHGSRHAAAVLPLLLDVTDEHERAVVRRTLAIALTHAVDEVREFAGSGVRAWLWERDGQFARRCVLVKLDYSRRRRRALTRRRSRERAEGFEDASRRLVARAREALASASGPAPSLDASVSLVRFVESDLLEALRLVPMAKADSSDLTLAARIFADLMEAEETRLTREGRRKVDLSFTLPFVELFAGWLLTSPGKSGTELQGLLVRAAEKAPELAAETLQKLLFAYERSRAGPFWVIWDACAQVAFGPTADSRVFQNHWLQRAEEARSDTPSRRDRMEERRPELGTSRGTSGVRLRGRPADWAHASRIRRRASVSPETRLLSATKHPRGARRRKETMHKQVDLRGRECACRPRNRPA